MSAAGLVGQGAPNLTLGKWGPLDGCAPSLSCDVPAPDCSSLLSQMTLGLSPQIPVLQGQLLSVRSCH